ncbi:MAG: stage III sporulation protein AF [Defluviitaleaceae bacterium]|nr:stage III sporulation protein AF [Defluviitaleaceae bacterium]
MLRDYVQNIAMVVIFTSFLGFVLPRGKYKDYIKLITGLVVILAVISPVAVFFDHRSLDDFFREAQRQIGMDIATNTNAIAGGTPFEDTMRRAVLDEYRAGLKTQISLKISNLGYELREASIYINEGNENFGMIEALVLTIAKKEVEEERGLIRVERVNVGTIGVRGLENEAADNDPEINAIKNLLSDFYNLSVENIHISNGH